MLIGEFFTKTTKSFLEAAVHKMYWLAVCLIALAVPLYAKPLGPPPQDTYVNVTEMIQNSGYPVENHLVTTNDGYILQVQRIPYGANGPTNNTRPVVLLQHGLFDTSATWVMNSPSESLAYILADAGFDVWLGNSRGNTYCQENILYSNETNQFWEYSYDQLAHYDLPAKINYIIAATNASSIGYVGHSEGTLMGFIEYSDNPTLARFINLFVALAPVAYMSNMGEPLRILAKDIPAEVLQDVFGYLGMFPSWGPIAAAGLDLAIDDPIIMLQGLCLIAGCDELHGLNKTQLPVYFGHFPGGSSVQNFLHYQQSVLSGNFSAYNWGESGNILHYGKPYPPSYNLTNLSVPTAYFYGSHDKLADPTDVQKMLTQVPTPVYVEEIKDFGHMDFVWSDIAYDRVYNTVTSLLLQHAQ